MLEPGELCLTCPKRDLCNCLCPEAEYYASQDQVKLRELTIGLPMYGNRPWPEAGDKPSYTPRELEVLHALAAGKTRAEVAKALGMTRKTLRSTIRNIKKRVHETV